MIPGDSAVVRLLRRYLILLCLANFSFCYNKNLIFCYISANVNLEKNANKLEIEIAKKRYKISLLKEPLHDPLNHFTKN